MTTLDPMSPQERALQERLRAALVPPATPDRLHYAIDELALDEMERGRPRRWAGVRTSTMSRRARVAFAVAVVAVLVAGSLLTQFAQPNRGQVAASPAAPSLLPLASPSPTTALVRRDVNAAQWISPTQAWAEVSTPDGIGVSFSDDAGLNWRAPYPEPGGVVGGGLTFLSRAFGYSVATTIDGSDWTKGTTMAVEVFITSDGGQNWSTATVGTMPIMGATGGPTSQVHFSDEQHGVVLAAIWEPQPSPPGEPNPGNAPVRCAGWTTDDSGATWTPMTSAPCAWEVLWASPTVGVAVRESWPDGGRTEVTRDGGRTWTRGSIPGIGTSDFVLSYGFISDGNRLQLILEAPVPRVTPGLPVAESTDGGATWRVARQWTQPDGGGGPMQVLGASDWLTSAADLTPSGGTDHLVESLDGGRTWNPVEPLPDNSLIERWHDRQHGVAMQMVNGTCSDPTLACGPANLRYLTSDGGLTWHLVTP